MLVFTSHIQKHRAYGLVKTAFRFLLRLCRLQSAYDVVTTRWSEAEAEELNQSQSMATCIVIGVSFRFCF